MKIAVLKNQSHHACPQSIYTYHSREVLGVSPGASNGGFPRGQDRTKRTGGRQGLMNRRPRLEHPVGNMSSVSVRQDLYALGERTPYFLCLVKAYMHTDVVIAYTHACLITVPRLFALASRRPPLDPFVCAGRR